MVSLEIRGQLNLVCVWYGKNTCMFLRYKMTSCDSSVCFVSPFQYVWLSISLINLQDWSHRIP
uniref:Uncharacterized protein n=1 Tax=Arundo donax TaxID=35708 RepID=A0A0A9BTA6_ARUDO